jgi:hypothetical protein
MNQEMIEWGLRVAGLMMVGLVVANFVAAKRWNYAANLAGTMTIVRQIFFVHCAYIVVIIAALALLCLGWPELLLEGSLARGFCGFWGLFWASRVVVQLCYYDPGLRRRERFWDVFFLAVFSALSGFFLLASYR